MIKEAKMGKEIIVRAENKIGVLAHISNLLAESGVDIEAIVGYAVDQEAKIILVTGDNLRATDALQKSGYKSIEENEVVIVGLENKPGALKIISTKLASETIDIKQIYGTACSSDCPAKIILSTSDNAKALLIFKK